MIVRLFVVKKMKQNSSNNLILYCGLLGHGYCKETVVANIEGKEWHQREVTRRMVKWSLVYRKGMTNLLNTWTQICPFIITSSHTHFQEDPLPDFSEPSLMKPKFQGGSNRQHLLFVVQQCPSEEACLFHNLPLELPPLLVSTSSFNWSFLYF